MGISAWVVAEDEGRSDIQADISKTLVDVPSLNFSELGVHMTSQVSREEEEERQRHRGGLRQTSQHWEVSRNLEAASTPEKPESLREEDKRRWAIVEREQKRKVVEERAVREGGGKL